MDEILISGAAKFGLKIDSKQAGSFAEYWNMLERANENMNLTAVTGREEACRRHFLDSLALFTAADFSGASVIDVGTGAGFPGIPIKIACNSADMTLLDSQQKRVDFLADVCDAINLDVTCIHARAEELGREPEYRDSFDFALSRAVARLDMLAELCLPLVKQGGRFIAMKAEDSQGEIEAARAAIETLGGRILPTVSYCVLGTDTQRKIAVIEKTKPTPEKYPRRFSRIQKRPII